jgi:uncharacterized membrane protein YdbT with pleckstrin-like domain
MGNYVDENLLPGETVDFRTGLHPVAAYGPAVAFFVLAVVLGALFGLPLFAIFGAIAVVLVVGGVVRMGNTEVAVTNRRVISKAGWLSTRSVEVNLRKVEGITVHQDLGGRIFGFATVSVTGTGGTKDGVQGIAHPFDLRRAVQEHLDDESAG